MKQGNASPETHTNNIYVEIQDVEQYNDSFHFMDNDMMIIIAVVIRAKLQYVKMVWSSPPHPKEQKKI